MIKEIFDKLRRCDKRFKVKHFENGDGDEPTLSIQTMRWLHTILQLMNYRFIRYLKYPFLHIYGDMLI